MLETCGNYSHRLLSLVSTFLYYVSLLLDTSNHVFSKIMFGLAGLKLIIINYGNPITFGEKYTQLASVAEMIN